MWENAITHIDEKYIAEAAEIAPSSETAVQSRPSKGGTGNLGFALAAAAAVIVSFIGVGFFLKGTGIEPLSPSSGSIGASDTEETADIPVTTTTAINEYTEITTAIAPIDRESYRDWFDEAEEIKEDYSRQIELKEKEIAECEKLVTDLEKELETEKFKEKADYDKVKAELEIERIKLVNLKIELEKLEADYHEQVLLIENNRKVYEELYPTIAETKQPLTMEKLKALVKEKGKDLTWSDFEPFEGNDVGSGLYIMKYPIDAAFTLVVGGTPTEKPWYIRLVCSADNSIFSISDNFYSASADNNSSDNLEEFIRKAGSSLSLARLEEISEKYDIPLDKITNIDIKTPNGTLYHDKNNHFYPMYLTFESDNRIVIDTMVRDKESQSFSGTYSFISIIFDKLSGEWERVLALPEDNPAILRGNSYSQKEMPSEIVIPEGITEIAEGVFMDCTQLEKVTLPSTLRVIGAGAFKDCTNLKEINIPYGVTTIGPRAFENCTSVYMVLPDTVTTIGDGAFAGCTQFDGTMKPADITPVFPGTEDFLLTCPVDNRDNISTRYGEQISGEFHDGTDFYGELGDNIYAAADGVVIGVADDKTEDGHGIHVTLKHEHNGQELQTFYAHLNEAIVKEGDIVSQGDIIGYMGSTGWSTGPHVHFSLFADGIILNPHLYLEPITLKPPVSNENTLYGYGYKQLQGIIYSGEKGQDISAAADGTVSIAEYKSNYGFYVVIDHENGYQTLYSHLDEMKVEVGTTVTAGQVIGTMGYTGLAEDVQLYFELSRYGRQINPMDYMMKQ